MSFWDWLNRRKKPNFYALESDRKTLEMMYCLEEYLASNRFGDASNFMGQLLLTSAKRDNEGYLNKSHLKQIPCERLQIIDKLWKYYSDGRFGLSVQYEILLECRNTEEYLNWEEAQKKHWEAEKKFWVRIGWKDKNEQSIFCDWHNSSKFNQPICEDFPLGNLPYVPQIGAYRSESYGIRGGLVKGERDQSLWFLILERLSKCDLQ